MSEPKLAIVRIMMLLLKNMYFSLHKVYIAYFYNKIIITYQLDTTSTNGRKLGESFS